MTSSRAWWLSLSVLLALGAGCTGRTTADATDAAGGRVDAGADAASADDAGTDAASTDDAGTDAASADDAGHDAAMTNVDSGCSSTPVCMDLPTTCHYDSTLEPCRCGMILCELPGCSPACSGGEYCAYPADTCGASGTGTCTPLPDLCSALVDPVCGCDGHTYNNECEAARVGQSVVYHGACETPTDCRTVGCASGSTCMACRGAGYVCLTTGTAC